MDTQQEYRDQLTGSYWAGIHVPKLGTIATNPVTEEDLQHLGMWEHVNRLPLTNAAYRTLPEEERDRVSADKEVALQPYHEFMNQYQENIDELSPTVHELLPEHALREQLDENPYPVARYLTEEGRRLLAETEADMPDRNRWDEYIEPEAFMDETTVLYAQTQDKVKEADLGWSLINLKLAQWNDRLNGWRNGMEDQAKAQTRTVEALGEPSQDEV